jgi:hypothetical protein
LAGITLGPQFLMDLRKVGDFQIILLLLVTKMRVMTAKLLYISDQKQAVF